MFGYEENKGPFINSNHGTARVVYVNWASYDGSYVEVCYHVRGDTFNFSNFYIGYWTADYIEKICY